MPSTKRKLYSISDMTLAVGTRPPVLLLCGEDPSSLVSAADEFSDLLDVSSNKRRFAANTDVERSRISEYLSTPDPFEPDRILQIDMTGATATSWKVMAPLLYPERIVPGCTAIVIADRWEKLPVAARRLPEQVMVMRIWPARIGEMKRKILGALKLSGKQIEETALEEIINRCGENVGILEHELEKIVAVPDGTIKLEHVSALVAEAGSSDEKTARFDLLRAIADGDYRSALESMGILTRHRIEPFSLLFMIAGRVRLANVIKAVMEEYPEHISGLADAARQMDKAEDMERFQAFKLRQSAGAAIRAAVSDMEELVVDFPKGYSPFAHHPNVIAAAVNYAARVDADKLLEALVLLRDYELNVKTGLADGHAAFLPLIHKLCSMVKPL